MCTCCRKESREQSTVSRARTHAGFSHKNARTCKQSVKIALVQSQSGPVVQQLVSQGSKVLLLFSFTVSQNLFLTSIFIYKLWDEFNVKLDSGFKRYVFQFVERREWPFVIWWKCKFRGEATPHSAPGASVGDKGCLVSFSPWLI